MEQLSDCLRWVLWILAALFLLWIFLMRCKRHLRRGPLLVQYRYAHRGLHDLAAGIPENSLPAFRRAAEQGFGAELDVHLTKDGRLAVIHDSDLRRLCGMDGIVEEMDAAQLSRLRLLGTEERIPFLEEILPLFAGGPPLLIEMKTRRNAALLADALTSALADYRGDYCVESFDPWALYVLRLRNPDCIRGQLSKHFGRDGGVNAVGGFFLGNLCFNWLSKPDFIAYRLQDRKSWALRLCRRLYRVQEFSWTVTTPEQQRQLEEAGSVIIFEGFTPTDLHR